MSLATRVFTKILGIALVFLGLIMLLTQQLFGWVVITQATDATIFTMLMVIIMVAGFGCMAGNGQEALWLCVVSAAWMFLLPFVLGGFSVTFLSIAGTPTAELGDWFPWFDLSPLYVWVTWLIPVAVIVSALFAIKLVRGSWDRNWVLGMVAGLIAYMFIIATWVL